jgi:transposase
LKIHWICPKSRILNTDMSGRDIVIKVESIGEWAICTKRGTEIRELHSYWLLLCLRHLPFLGRPVITEIRPTRFRCPACDGNPATNQKLNWYDERCLHSKAYD